MIIACCSALLAGMPCHAALADARNEVAALIREYYPEAVDPQVFQASTAREMVRRLGDPYSGYLSEEELEAYLGDLDGSFSGIGIYMDMKADGIVVLDIMPDSPASTAGMQAGDVIVEVNHVSLAGLDLEQAQDLILGRPGSRVIVTIVRAQEQIEMTMTRAEIIIPSVTSKLLGQDTGYLNLDSFGSSTAHELGKAIQGLKNRGVKQWILDLRGNGGGYVYASAEVAGYFLDVDNLVTVQDKQDRVHMPVIPETPQINEPVLLLVDEYSASASELLAAALKDYDEATLLGETTYGKGTMQQVFPLSNGDLLKLTIAQFYSPFGNKIHTVGVKPDLAIDPDQALEAAELLFTHTAAGASKGYLKQGDQQYMVDLTTARSEKFWQAWGSLCTNVNALQVDTRVTSDQHSFLLDSNNIRQGWPIYYPAYQYMGEYQGVNPAKPVYLAMESLEITDSGVDTELELVERRTGKRVKYQLEARGSVTVLKPQEAVTEGEYWLVHNHAVPGTLCDGTLTVLHFSN